ncbi:hypothetical protein EXIGLDRAFT_773946 [Exidia glandulosa HHB12029]|uniref:Uncharacterized protein n=1 Tax=Exidia glandulosa HHB12029 TaxID=1314781 RepID=A0A165EKJ4_EXIGL|nr:hypothetical protein EXIGLDRAFT_773946 [Exidia glandulosa HHB12029]
MDDSQLGNYLKDVLCFTAASGVCAPAILFLLGLWLSSFDFAIRATEPYRLLSDAPRPARFLAFAPLSSGEYTIIPRSVSRKTFLIVLAAFASLLLPAAKIVVAGLFAEMENTVSVATTLPLNTRFNHTCDAIWDFGLWTYTVSAGFHLNRPTWATREYAIGSIGLPNTEKSTIVARLPVAYTDLEQCQVVKTQLVLPFMSTGDISYSYLLDNHPLCPAQRVYADRMFTSFSGRHRRSMT